MECCIFTGIQMGTHHKRTGSDMLVHGQFIQIWRKKPVNTPVIVKIGEQIWHWLSAYDRIIKAIQSNSVAYNANLKSCSTNSRSICQCLCLCFYLEAVNLFACVNSTSFIDLKYSHVLTDNIFPLKKIQYNRNTQGFSMHQHLFKPPLPLFEFPNSNSNFHHPWSYFPPKIIE